MLTRDHEAAGAALGGAGDAGRTEADAPVEIAAGTLGAHRALRLSGNHRVLLTGARAELLFGEAEVLVKAKHLVDGRAVRSGGGRGHYHLLFDRHEVVMANGLPCGLHTPAIRRWRLTPGCRTRSCGLFPILREGGFGPLARVEVKGREARLLGR
ncbi:MAG: Hint domain-containing protein [Paracoccaceae bacterium]